MKCSKCGKDVKENEKFCSNCGSKIKMNKEQQANNSKKEKIIIVVIAVVLIFILSLFFNIFSGKKNILLDIIVGNINSNKRYS